MIRRFPLFLLVVFLLQFRAIMGQTPLIDSLKRQVLVSKTATSRLQAVLAVCEQRQSLNTDTLYYFASMAKKLAADLDDANGIQLADYFVANSLVRRGNLDQAMEITEKALATLTWQKNKNAYAKFMMQKGQMFIKTSKYKEALEVFYKLLGESEEQRDTITQINVKNNIGWVNMEMGRNAVALEWFYKTLNTGTHVSPDYYSVVYSNMAATYNEIDRNDSAEYFIRKAIAINRKTQSNLQFLANALAIEADILMDTRRKTEAEAPLNEALSIRKQIGEPFYIVSDMTQLALYYANTAQSKKGIALCLEGIQMARQFNLSAKLPILYEALAENYKAGKNYEQYGQTLQHIVALKDSLYEKNSAESLAELQARYNFQKVQNTVIKQQLDITRKDYDITRKNYLLYGSLLITIFILVTSYFIFKNYRRKNKMRMQLMLQDEKNRAEMEVLEAKEAERKRIAADLHDNLGAYAASIASNLDNIKLNSTDNGSQTALQELRNNSQAMVSQLNDTIWVMKKDALSLTSISDRLKIFIQRVQSSYPLIKMDVIENIQHDHLLAPSQAFHLLHVLQEAVNNAIRHSGGNQVTVAIESNGTWKMTITDNGRGMRGSENKEGNGLSNMKERAREAGWSIDWQGCEQGGTLVSISPGTTN
jgi:signal transduction histidine kinase/tetratricopeptide (TPR) repeat protein